MMGLRFLLGISSRYLEAERLVLGQLPRIACLPRAQMWPSAWAETQKTVWEGTDLRAIGSVLPASFRDFILSPTQSGRQTGHWKTGTLSLVYLSGRLPSSTQESWGSLLVILGRVVCAEWFNALTQWCRAAKAQSWKLQGPPPEVLREAML